MMERLARPPLAAALVALALAAAASAQEVPGPPADGAEPDSELVTFQVEPLVEPDPPPDPATTFVSANAAYEAGDFQGAIELFTSLIEHGHADGRLHYNLANAYLRNGELGRAVASYLRARSLRPRDRDLAANLAFARRSAKDAIEPPAPSAVAEALFFWHYRLSAVELAGLTLALNLLFWGALALRAFRRESGVLRWLAALVLVPLLLAGGSLALRQLRPARVAVVVPVEIEARSAPTSDSVVRFKLHAGTELELVADREGWLRIVLPDGQQGWIESRHAEIVEA